MQTDYNSWPNTTLRAPVTSPLSIWRLPLSPGGFTQRCWWTNLLRLCATVSSTTHYTQVSSTVKSHQVSFTCCRAWRGLDEVCVVLIRPFFGKWERVGCAITWWRMQTEGKIMESQMWHAQKDVAVKDPAVLERLTPHGDPRQPRHWWWSKSFTHLTQSEILTDSFGGKRSTGRFPTSNL